MKTKKDYSDIMQSLRIGDIVFIQVKPAVFREVATATKSWTNHVGIVVDNADGIPLIAESTFPVARCTPMTDFIQRSKDERFAVTRLKTPITADQERRIMVACMRRMGVFYGTGFDLNASRQFCSRFVYEVVNEALGVQVGDIETFSDLLSQNPDANLHFWRFWFLGRIPWKRQTVTPASVLKSAEIEIIYDTHGLIEQNLAGEQATN